MNKMILSLAVAALLPGCNALQWNSDILGGRASETPAPVSADPGAPLSAIPTDESIAGLGTDVQPGGGAGVPTSGPTAGPSFQGSATTVASLGDPAIPGLWMETPLVGTEQLARLRGATGKDVVVTLKPAPAGSAGRLSISAMRALGAPLTELVEVQILPAG